MHSQIQPPAKRSESTQEGFQNGMPGSFSQAPSTGEADMVGGIWLAGGPAWQMDGSCGVAGSPPMTSDARLLEDQLARLIGGEIERPARRGGGIADLGVLFIRHYLFQCGNLI